MFRSFLHAACVALTVGAPIGLAGCNGSLSSGPATPSEHDEGDGHDHSGEAARAHPTKGPHGGQLIELGNEEYHAELIHDETTHKVSVHLLDAAGKQAVAVAVPEITIQLLQGGQFTPYTLKAVPAGAPSASQFELVDQKLCEALCGNELIGRLQVTIEGKAYAGVIQHDLGDDGSHAGHSH
ncbi:MAG: hypothetical protein KJ000_18660 [Pirellulaceae bacterium]|nr:hypothetical protein [Pirellulaceae bacterium]